MEPKMFKARTTVKFFGQAETYELNIKMRLLLTPLTE
jgi:hypothetical protein